MIINGYLILCLFFIQPFVYYFAPLLMLVYEPPPSLHTPEASPSPLVAASPSQVFSAVTRDENDHSYHLTLIPGVGIAVTAIAVIMLVVLIILIRRKNKELENFENTGKTSSKDFPPPRPIRKLQEGPFFFVVKCFLNFGIYIYTKFLFFWGAGGWN